MAAGFVTNKPLSRGAKRRIANAIADAQNHGVCLNLYDLANRVIEDMSRDLPGDMMEYHTEQMGLTTTGEIMEAIQTYIFTSEPARIRAATGCDSREVSS